MTEPQSTTKRPSAQSGTSRACAAIGLLCVIASPVIAFIAVVATVNDATTVAGLHLAGGALISGVLLIAVSQHLDQQRAMLTALHAIALRESDRL